ncbi:hypothetical protein C8F01DRAFT_1140904 [Mycena amicta]|nr:hypothetical protein C8F01DRAFT_1140904 [Mycena amicta]
MDFVQTGFGIHESWWYAIENWGNIASLQHGPWTALITPIICGIISALVQIFYAFRIWRLKPQFLPRVSAVLIVLLALLQSLAAIVADSLLGRNLSQANLIRRHPIFMLWLSVSFVTDILIAGSMILILYTAKTKFDTSISRVDSLLNRLILNTIRTGALTVVCAGTTLALFVKYTDKDYYRVLYVCCLQFNSLLRVTLFISVAILGKL